MRLPKSFLNPTTLFGIVIAAVALIIIVILLILGATGLVASPYSGILAFLIGPVILVLGLVLIPVGAWRKHRQVEVKPLPILNLNEPAQQRRAAVFGVATLAIVAVMTTATWQATNYMESTQFCGGLCHKVMQPEAVAHQASPHANVSCVECHIGSGTSWFVRSKISGTRQVVAVTLNTYQRPIAAPIKDLRPARDTCEECHWPQSFSGSTLKLFVQYKDDEKNTPRYQSLAFRVGGSREGLGIHWHTQAKLWYLPLDDARREIAWVKVENPDGSVSEYVLPAQQQAVTPERIKQDQRFMDCIDCHNRATHRFNPIDSEIDNALYQGLISRDLPYIKRQATQAVGEVGTSVNQEQYDQALQRIDAIEDYYRAEQPETYARSPQRVKQAVAEIRDIYERSVFPFMGVTPATYRDQLGHDGCFRCHGKLVGVKGVPAGTRVGNECDKCHVTAPASLAAMGGRDVVEELSAPTAAPAATAAPPAATPPPPAATPSPGPPATPTATSAAGQALAATPVATHTPAATAATSEPTATVAPRATAVSGLPPAVTHSTTGREQCSACHQVAAAGVGPAQPANHEGRTDGTCLGCHAAGQ